MRTDFSPNTEWRKTAASIYRKPVDSKILGSAEIDVTDLEAFITAKRKQGLKVTMTHFFTLAVARALREEVPELNCYVRRGNIVRRATVDATISVLIKNDTEMGSVRVVSADRLTLRELAEHLQDAIQRSKQGDEDRAMRSKAVLAAIPWPFRDWVMGLIKRLSIDWGLAFPGMGFDPGRFGSFILSNIGSIGLDIGYPALFPSANMSMVFIMGSLNTKPAVVEGLVVPRRIMTIGAALDHRVVDAVHGGRLFKYLKKAVTRPEVFDERPEWVDG